ncbi:uncharacterized protein [Physcomitrium patens]|uniref:uncharacterized protein isoform X2 n=1 Tax=Physcomitrium patens TaxID=3218 RepID=UPI003CCD0064
MRRHPSHPTCRYCLTNLWMMGGRPDADNSERNLWTHGQKVTPNSNCGPKLPSNFFELPTKQRLRAVKMLLAGYVYKPNSETSLQANKQRPLCRLMATARMIVYKPGPIKAVEAVFLALYLTAGLLSVERIPVGFKTKFADEVTQHTVLLVKCNGKYGAFGINSNPDLMTKNLQFDSMSNIIKNYLKAYEASAHTVLKIRIGLPVEHDVMSSRFICWRHLSLSPNVESWQECAVEIENHVIRMRRLWDLWVLTRKVVDSRKAGMAKRKLVKSNLIIKPRGKGKEKQPEVAAPAMKMPGESAPRRKSKDASISTERTQHWDAESTGSNSIECEHCEECEQLKRDIPPSDTKCVSLKSTVKEMKTTGHHHFPENRKSHGDHSHTSEQQVETESFESNTGDSSVRKLSVDFKPQDLNQSSMATRQQMIKNLMSNRVTMSTPPSCSASRGGTRNPTEKAAHIKLPSKHASKKNSGPLYNFSVGQGRKSTAG